MAESELDLDAETETDLEGLRQDLERTIGKEKLKKKMKMVPVTISDFAADSEKDGRAFLLPGQEGADDSKTPGSNY